MLYFAYGSNMDPRQMRERCTGARPVGAARLAGHRLVFTRDAPGWGGGVASIEPAPGDEVWGVLWEITPADEEALDEYEGVAVGAYRKARVAVERGTDAREALVYVANPRAGKPPSRRYLAALVRGAASHGLPAPYVARLRGLSPERVAR